MFPRLQFVFKEQFIFTSAWHSLIYIILLQKYETVVHIVPYIMMKVYRRMKGSMCYVLNLNDKVLQVLTTLDLICTKSSHTPYI